MVFFLFVLFCFFAILNLRYGLVSKCKIYSAVIDINSSQKLNKHLPAYKQRHAYTTIYCKFFNVCERRGIYLVIFVTTFKSQK